MGGILLLLSADADVTIKNMDGKNAYELAQFFVKLVETNADKPETNPPRSFSAVEKREAYECCRLLKLAWSSKIDLSDKMMEAMIQEEEQGAAKSQQVNH